ncbi:Neuropeptide FF receptor [Echinococcus granulosus]|uniref:Neuropeptide FF receptor n=1 Tax=Echinococcus granulosus TaxID=6210 RepID=W6U3F7_ECHGR|nr:Neuropeptide FF receptor [Echinococcus granulosus]EUB55635.1 Neuropeptide FF receptor [Echinococcus granulosus]
MNNSTVATEPASPTWEFAHSYPIVTLLSVSYATIFIAGLLGNFAVITIVLRNHHMRSVTNIFICNLSVADLLVTVFVEPLTLLQNIVVGASINLLYLYAVKAGGVKTHPPDQASPNSVDFIMNHKLRVWL